MRHVFFIGPGGVGKTTVGEALAKRLARRFIDLDREFCRQVSPIREFLDANGYPAYLRRNSLLLQELLLQAEQTSIFALSSGFLVTDAQPELQQFNREFIRNEGISILLMPSRDFDESMEIVVDRQLHRGLSLDRVSQITTFTARFQLYMQMGDIQIFSTRPADEQAAEIAQRLSF